MTTTRQSTGKPEDFLEANQFILQDLKPYNLARVMSGARIDCGKKITDSLIGKDVEILDSAQRLPEGHRLILGDMAIVTL